MLSRLTPAEGLVREDETESTRNDAPRFQLLIQRWTAAAIPSFALLLYSYFYQLTKASPLAAAEVPDRLVVLAYAVVTASMVSLAAFLVGALVDHLLGAATRRSSLLIGSTAAVACVYATAALIFTENLLYSATGWGLRVDESVTSKLGFGILAVSLGLLIARRAVRLRIRTARAVAISTAVAALIGSVVVVQTVATIPAVPELSPEKGVSPRPYNVVILSSDGIEANHMSVYGYERSTTPFLDRIADQFLVFENAFSNANKTTGSITSLLTGRSPLVTGVLGAPDMLRAEHARLTLPYLLGGQGYFRSNRAVRYYADATDQNLVQAFDVDNGDQIGSSLLHQLPIGTGTGRWFTLETLGTSKSLIEEVLGIGRVHDPFSQIDGSAAAWVTQDAERLRGVLNDIHVEEPFFINTHFLVTHGPDFSTLTARKFSRGITQKNGWATAFYDDTIRQFDSYIRRVYKELERTGKLERTIIIVTSDHGKRWNATERVPLMIRFPGGAHVGFSHANAQRIDIAPTILDALGYQRPRWMTGRSLTSKLPQGRLLVAASTHSGRTEGSDFLGTAPSGPTLIGFRCRHWVRQFSDGRVERGTVTGSTSTCNLKPHLAPKR